MTKTKKAIIAGIFLFVAFIALGLSGALDEPPAEEAVEPTVEASVSPEPSPSATSAAPRTPNPTVSETEGVTESDDDGLTQAGELNRAWEALTTEEQLEACDAMTTLGMENWMDEFMEGSDGQFDRQTAEMFFRGAC